MGETTILWALLRGLAGWTLEMIAQADREHPFSPHPVGRLGLGTCSQLRASLRGTRLDCDEVDQDSWGPRPWHSGVVHFACLAIE